MAGRSIRLPSSIFTPAGFVPRPPELPSTGPSPVGVTVAPSAENGKDVVRFHDLGPSFCCDVVQW
jgi:hypothetical protein